MSSAKYSTGSHEHTAIVLSSPGIMCSWVCRGNYISISITETSGWTHLGWGCCPASARIFKQHLVTRFQEVHLGKKKKPPGHCPVTPVWQTPWGWRAHSTNIRILQGLRGNPEKDQMFIKLLLNTRPLLGSITHDQLEFKTDQRKVVGGPQCHQKIF